jgi:hypothetical protein
VRGWGLSRGGSTPHPNPLPMGEGPSPVAASFEYFKLK